jgi:hypothetical protein
MRFLFATDSISVATDYTDISFTLATDFTDRVLLG